MSHLLCRGIFHLFVVFGLVLAGAATGAASQQMPSFPEDALTLRDDVYLQLLRPGVWRHVSFEDLPGIGPFPSNGLVVSAAEGVLLIDTAWNPEQTAAVLDWAERELGAVRALIVTHAHGDRMGGISEVHARAIPSLAYTATAEFAQASGAGRIQQAVPSPYGLEPWGLAGEIYFPGGAHTADNAVVYLAQSQVLAGSCMVRAMAMQSMGNTADADMTAWPASIMRLQQRYPAVEVVVPGHGLPGGAELLRHTLDILKATSGAANE
jgi:glyoxylase-like metal-dependent hydrolase (beta-lactamase superfamily II)